MVVIQAVVELSWCASATDRGVFRVSARVQSGADRVVPVPLIMDVLVMSRLWSRSWCANATDREGFRGEARRGADRGV